MHDASWLHHVYFQFTVNIKKKNKINSFKRKIIAFWDLTQSSVVDFYQLFRGTYYILLQGSLKMEATHSSEMLANLYKISWNHIPEASNP